MKTCIPGWRQTSRAVSTVWFVFLAITACSDAHLSRRSDHAGAAAGVVEIALTTTTSAAAYRLRNAVFEVSGPTSLTLTSESDVDAELITQSLRPGMFQVLLREGWTLEKRTPAGYRPVEATLLSESLREFTIVAGETTALRYRFSTNGEVVDLGDGQLDIGIEVEETADASVDAGPDEVGRIRARAFIDGRSQLVIRGSDVSWRHFDFAAPGLHVPYREPTELWSQAGTGPEQHAVWCPVWPTGCNTCEGTCGELRDTQIESLPFTELSPPFPRSVRAASLTLTVLAGRGTITIVESPSGGDDALIVELDDNSFGGAEYYDFTIAYTISP